MDCDGLMVMECWWNQWVDGDGMLVEPMEILGNRWKKGMEFWVSKEKKKGTKLLFSSQNTVTPRGVGL